MKCVALRQEVRPVDIPHQPAQKVQPQPYQKQPHNPASEERPHRRQFARIHRRNRTDLPAPADAAHRLCQLDSPAQPLQERVPGVSGPLWRREGFRLRSVGCAVGCGGRLVCGLMQSPEVTPGIQEYQQVQRGVGVDCDICPDGIAERRVDGSRVQQVVVAGQDRGEEDGGCEPRLVGDTECGDEQGGGEDGIVEEKGTPVRETAVVVGFHGLIELE